MIKKIIDESKKEMELFLNEFQYENYDDVSNPCDNDEDDDDENDEDDDDEDECLSGIKKSNRFYYASYDDDSTSPTDAPSKMYDCFQYDDYDDNSSDTVVDMDPPEEDEKKKDDDEKDDKPIPVYMPEPIAA